MSQIVKKEESTEKNIPKLDDSITLLSWKKPSCNNYEQSGYI